MKTSNIIILVLLAAIALLIWFWPKNVVDEKRKREYETAIAVLEAEKAEIQSKQDSSQKMVKDTIEAYKVVLGAQKRETAYWKEKSKERRVVIKEIIESDPDVLAFVQSQDSVILSLESENFTLTKQALFNEQVYKDLIAMELQEDRTEEMMRQQMEKRIADLERDVKKAKKKTVGAVIIGGLATIGAFLLAK